MCFKLFNNSFNAPEEKLTILEDKQSYFLSIHNTVLIKKRFTEYRIFLSVADSKDMLCVSPAFSRCAMDF